LDDTLFDHRHSARAALAAVAAAHGLAAHPLADLEAEYHRLLTEMHPRVLARTLTPDQARRERYRLLLQYAGVTADDAMIDHCLGLALTAYREARRPVLGAPELLELLRRDYRIGVISNNFLAEQDLKLTAIGLRAVIDGLIVSDDVGFTKPDPRIFAVAMTRLGVGPADCLMIGDAWEGDVRGALQAGMRAIWFNRFGQPNPDPAAVQEVSSFIPAAAARDLIRACLAGPFRAINTASGTTAAGRPSGGGD
ncbi:HAD family hydrolase, partial [bacterium]|nr:HAD family hydrolase [bacterium]